VTETNSNLPDSPEVFDIGGWKPRCWYAIDKGASKLGNVGRDEASLNRCDV
jgi:hypothetical protein